MDNKEFLREEIAKLKSFQPNWNSCRSLKSYQK